MEEFFFCSRKKERNQGILRKKGEGLEPPPLLPRTCGSNDEVDLFFPLFRPSYGMLYPFSWQEIDSHMGV